MSEGDKRRHILFMERYTMDLIRSKIKNKPNKKIFKLCLYFINFNDIYTFIKVLKTFIGDKTIVIYPYKVPNINKLVELILRDKYNSFEYVKYRNDNNYLSFNLFNPFEDNDFEIYRQRMLNHFEILKRLYMNRELYKPKGYIFH